MTMRKSTLVLAPLLIVLLAVSDFTAGDKEEAVPKRPRVPGTLRLNLRSWKQVPANSGKFQPYSTSAQWKAAETAIIVCDMWDDHFCKSAAQRVGVMAPKMNEVLTAARNHGVMIIHAPSGTMKEYEGTPYRKRMQQANPAKPPAPIEACCHLDP